ncbi:MAG TPA: N-acetylmuramic acid 6-phosphate etherase [Acidobacteriaceae bacterium]|jgi:N-acetylmuramic acid 6-phosphate etherase|nr:N-acetylmuramic acid 6-phosphate etherase [Acidobacteriaceae bacterium]
MAVSTGKLATEASNPATAHIDALSTRDMLELISAEDARVAAAVHAEIPHIARAIDEIVLRFAKGGRLFYIGAGTSGRLGVLDASECPPTFSVPAGLVQGIIAGGDAALRTSSEKSEDSREEGSHDLELRNITANDVVCGIAASGRTPYVLGGVTYAKALGALTIGLSCVPGSELSKLAEIAITPATGAEVLTGSTRLKAGTATKLVLNMLTTGVMIRSGYTYGNLMVNVQPTNEKLVDRAQRIIAAATNCTAERAAELLTEAGSVKVAIVMQQLQLPRAAAEQRLAANNGNLRETLMSA